MRIRVATMFGLREKSLAERVPTNPGTQAAAVGAIIGRLRREGRASAAASNKFPRPIIARG
jgi:hypothetical protein